MRSCGDADVTRLDAHGVDGLAGFAAILEVDLVAGHPPAFLRRLGPDDTRESTQPARDVPIKVLIGQANALPTALPGKPTDAR